MKHKNNQNQIPAGEPRPIVTAGLNHHVPTAKEADKKASLEAGGNFPEDFVPSPEEVSRRAYFAYVNQGSQPGHEVQHWLKAEAELIAERKLTRVHGFNHRN
ncbi:MAG: DUF2934 domain-containing protein [Limisphaerales bacterium]